MNIHSIFYYPYGDFRNKDLPLLKVAALYFDKLYILDPLKAVSGGEEFARDNDQRNETTQNVRLLAEQGIVEMIDPAAILAQYNTKIEAAIRNDLQDREYLNLCGKSGRASKWMLSLAKVPSNILQDKNLQHLMGSLPNNLITQLEPYYQKFTDQQRYEELQPEPYTEYSTLKDKGKRIEYRWREFALPLGESIMVNHALFGGLLHLGATPLTDDPFHNQVLSLKLRRAIQNPAIQQALADRARVRQLKANQLAAITLADTQLNLPILNPKLPLAEVLEYRQKHDADLRQARERLGWIARRIESEPWSEDFALEIEHKTIPDIAEELDEIRKGRDAWFSSQRGRLALQAASVTIGAAVAVLTLFASPLTPVTLATAGLGLASGTAIPGMEWLLDWRNGKKVLQENGLHYLLETPG